MERRQTMAGGGSTKDCSCLCGLVGRYLRQHAVALAPGGRLDESLSSSKPEDAAGAPRTISKEAEKDILISLTLVLREIKRWTTEADCDYEQDSGLCSIFCGDCSCHMEPPFGCQTCSANTALLLVVFLAGNNQYVRHMAVEVLVAISNFLLQYVSKWEEFICFLWMSLRVAMNSCISAGSFALNVVHCHRNTEASTTLEGSEDDAHFAALLQTRLKNSDWLMPAALMQVLHTIQKSLKKEDGGLLESYLHYAIFFLLKMPWSLWSKLFSAQSNGSSVFRSAVGGDPCKLETNSVFLGAVLQLLCSLVEQNELEVGNSPLEESSVYFKFTNIISEILVCCFSNHHKYSSCMYQYLRHKVLVLMIRLSYWPHWQCSSLVSWLKLLHNYFKDILNENITIGHDGHDISVEGSPFLSSVIDGGKVEKICTTHLQRQTIFLFLKSCFTLIRFGNRACPECMRRLDWLTCELQKDGERYCFDGLSEISGWLQRHVPLIDYAVDMNCMKLCRRFSLSFLQLYIDEDDLLFEMLLQLLDSPFFTMQGQHDKHDNVFEKLGRDVNFHMSNIFNPIHLFHLFLLLIHYDHLVLLDYLISRDTGVSFVHYLLRCIRLVCKSWSSFVEFSMCSTEIGQPCFKRRKLCWNGQDSIVVLGHTFSTTDSTDDSRVLKTGDGKMNEVDSKQASPVMAKTLFQDAKGCLLSLKTSVEDLHRKNLFPYSPAPLIRSFTRFQEVCEAGQQRIDGH